MFDLDHEEPNAAVGDSSHPTAPTEEKQEDNAAPSFAEFGVHEPIVTALNAAGIERTFPIQELTLPLALGGEDVIGQARTGTGKTLGFGVPLLQRLELPGEGTPQALVVVPTRELCMQVTKDLTKAGEQLGVRITALYGGRPYEPQIAALQEGVDIVVGTPGRLLDLAEQQHLVLGKVRMLVLDEADEMLDLGFLPDIERILRMVPEQRQTMLFSATMPDPIITLARTFMTKPTHIRAEEVDAGAVHEQTEQFVYRAHSLDKLELVARALQARERGRTMIFTRTKRTAQRLADDLGERGFAVSAVHGDLGQANRERALLAFRSGKVDVLVATDVAARGIDVTDVTHVVNYQCPEDEKVYVHRIGRTGRAGKKGVAITLVDWDELERWKLVSAAHELGIPNPPETYSTSEHLFADLDIPQDATGRLSMAKRTGSGSAEKQDEDTAGKRRNRSGGQSGGGDAVRSSNRNRSRRRTRGGVAVTSDKSAEQDTSSQAQQQARTGPRRRRRRGGSGSRAAQSNGSDAG